MAATSVRTATAAQRQRHRRPGAMTRGATDEEEDRTCGWATGLDRRVREMGREETEVDFGPKELFLNF